METLKKSMVGSIIVLSLVGITFPTPYAHAATQAELQAQIQALLAQIASLQAQIGGSKTGSCSVFTRDLTLGVQGNEVTSLQQFLIAQGHTIPAGATGYFGGQTQQALTKFQVAQGISPAVGYFGPVTRAKAQNLCTLVVTPAPTTPTTPTTPTNDETTLSGEAFIDRFEVSDGEHTDLEEEDKNMEVMEVSFRVTDGDVKITRFDLGFTPDAGNNEKDPWDTFGTIGIYQGSKKIAEIDGSREKNWKEDNPSAGSYMIRTSGFSWIIKEDKTADIVIKSSVQNGVKGTADGEIWNIFVPDNGIRGFDADNATVFAGDTADAVTLNIDQAGATDEIIVRRSNEDRDASVLQVEDSNRSGFIKVLTFDIDTDDSKNDIEIRRLPVQFTVSTSTLNTFMRDIRLVVDGTSYTKETTVDGATGTVTFEFNKNEFVIDAGDRISIDVEVDFKALASQYEGTTITGNVIASNITAKGKETLTSNQLAGTVSGEIHTLASKGSNVTPTSEKFTSTVTSVDGALNDYVTFSMTFTLNAFGQDVFIPISTDGVSYQLTDSLGNALIASGTAVISSSADEEGNYFKINEGTSESITLEVTYVPGVANTTARLQLLSVHYNDEPAAPDQTWNAQPASKYRTPTKTIVN